MTAAEGDLITRSYIKRQLWSTQASKELNNEFRLYMSKSPKTPHHKAAQEFLYTQGLPVISYFTFNTEDIYSDHFLFYFTHAAYYEYTQLLRTLEQRMDTVETFTISNNAEFRTGLETERVELSNRIEELYFDIKENPSILWESVSYAFIYEYQIESLEVTNPDAYEFMGVFNTVPTKICYL